MLRCQCISVCPSVCDVCALWSQGAMDPGYLCMLVTEGHWRIIANLGFKFRSQFTAHCGRGACGREGRDHRREISNRAYILTKNGGIISRYASHF